MSTLQAQRNIQEVVFGPYESRRFGRSLGVNPLPHGARLCNFDCIYCECATGAWPLRYELRPQLPTAEDIFDAIVEQTSRLGPDELDAITIAGNGEPTLSFHLEEIVSTITAVRDRDWPRARTVILTNGTTCHLPRVRRAFAMLDERIVKVDAGTNWLLDQINQPVGPLSIAELLHRISMVPDIIVQSMFVHGPVDNTGPREVEAWAELLVRLRPLSVQIYSLDRMPAKSWVRQVPRTELESIARYAESTTSIPVHVF